MHGYELHQSFTDHSPLGQIWRLGISQTYKLLGELEEEGHVQATVEAQESRPDRKVYHVTPSGEQAFLKWLLTPVSGIRLMRVEFLGKLFLAQALGPEMVERIIAGQTEACETVLSRLEERMPGEGFHELVLRFRTGQMRAAIDWLAHCREELLTGSSRNR
jgi:DNA-binding PadR family transcriptional regulator